MPTVTTDAPFPPSGTQVAKGPGTLASVRVLTPDGYQPNTIPGSEQNAYFIDATIFDAADAYDKSMPLIAIFRLSGIDDPALDIPFERGLYIDQRSPSGITLSGDWQA